MRHPRTAAVRIVSALLLLTVEARPVRTQEFVPICNGTNLKGWMAEHTKVEARDGVLKVGQGNG